MSGTALKMFVLACACELHEIYRVMETIPSKPRRGEVDD